MLLIRLLVKMLWIICKHSIEAFEIYRICAFPIWRLNNNVVYHVIVLNVRCLIFLHFWMWDLSQSSSLCCILEQNMDLAHLDLCRGDLDWVRLRFVDACCLVWIPTRGLPRRLFLSIKLFSNFGTSLVNLRTYCWK